MSEESDLYLSLLSIFSLCSVIAVGGATAAVGETVKGHVQRGHDEPDEEKKTPGAS